MKLRLIVFDLDGTLVDSRRDIADAANALLTECGAPALPHEQIARMVGEGAATLVARAFTAVGTPAPPDALARFMAIYEKRLVAHTRPYPGVVDTLGVIAEKTSLAVLTNKPLHATREILDRLGLARFFQRDLVLGGDGPLPRKPDPAGLRQLMEMKGADAGETMMVGDSAIDWRTAVAADARACLARYGFGFDGFPVASLRPDDRLIDRAEELTDLVS